MDDPLVWPVNKTTLSILPIATKLVCFVQITWMYYDTKSRHITCMLDVND